MTLHVSLPTSHWSCMLKALVCSDEFLLAKISENILKGMLCDLYSADLCLHSALGSSQPCTSRAVILYGSVCDVHAEVEHVYGGVSSCWCSCASNICC